MFYHLVLGGARSGKSQFAEQQAQQCASKHDLELCYVATATAKKDNEMQSRIISHQARRKSSWSLIEEPLDLASVIHQAHSNHCLLIDCLTLWLTNALLDHCWPKVREDFFKALDNHSTHIYFVSNEVGSGIVPMGELSRDFVDEAGRLHQDLAKYCDRVSVVIAGLPLPLKPSIYCEE